jgi:hypothetical protein
MLSADPDFLPFSGGGETPVQYFLTWDHHRYYVRYRFGVVSVEKDDDYVNEYEKEIGGEWDGVWTDEETTVYLYEISQAIRNDSLESLDLPTLYETRSHAFFKKDKYPYREVGLTRAGQEIVSVPASEVEQWILDNPWDHEHLRIRYREIWNSYIKLQRSTVDAKNQRHYHINK